MVRKYKRQAKNVEDEIQKLQNLDAKKENEISNLNEEINILNQIQMSAANQFEQQFTIASKMINENRGIIKRQDKLIVDLHEKNELCMIRIAHTDEEVLKENRNMTKLEMQIKEIQDKRQQYSMGNNNMHQQLAFYRQSLQQKTKG